MSEKKRYIVVELLSGDDSCGGYIADVRYALDGIVLSELGEDDSYKFTCVMMTQEELDALPEFTGW